MRKNILAIIPMRSGSTGVPRKNIRPLLGKPLFTYAVEAIQNTRLNCHLVVVTNDEEALQICQRLKVSSLKIPAAIAAGDKTLDEVVTYSVPIIEELFARRYETILTVQATVPLILSSDIDGALEKFFASPRSDSLISVVNDTHLRWSLTTEGYGKPEYVSRLNRQFLPQSFKETGAIVICNRDNLKTGSRIGQEICLHEVPQDRSVDIDTFDDFLLCEAILRRRKIVFVVIGNQSVGLGHVYRLLLLADELTGHSVEFVCTKDSGLAFDVISRNKYIVEKQCCDDLAELIVGKKPQLVINDILDTTLDYMLRLKKSVPAVINFEDLGEGAYVADATINALYSHEVKGLTEHCGPKYLCLRNEFIWAEKREQINDSVKNVLMCFGGVDPNNFTLRFLRLLVPMASNNGFKVTAIVGPGYPKDRLDQLAELECDGKVQVVHDTCRIADFMSEADIGISSGGRTAYELAAMRVPSVIVCQNNRETTHLFSADSLGLIDLGLGSRLADFAFCETLSNLVNNRHIRQQLFERQKESDLVSGKSKVLELIHEHLGDIKDQVNE